MMLVGIACARQDVFAGIRCCSVGMFSEKSKPKTLDIHTTGK